MKTWIRKLNIKLRPRKIRSRFMIAMIVVSVTPLFVLGYSSYNIAKDTLVKNHMQSNEDHLKTAIEVADLLVRNFINMNRMILADTELRQELLGSGMDNGNEHTVIDVSTANRLQYVVGANLIETKYIDSICLFDRSFRSVCYGRSESAGLYGNEGTRGEISKASWYKKSFESQGREVFFGYNVLEESYSSDTFSSVKLLRDPARLYSDPLGLLVINIKKSMFEKVFNESTAGEFMVIDSQDNRTNVVYDNRHSLYGKIPMGESLTITLQNLLNSGYLVTQDVNQTTGWTFVHLMKSKELLKQSNQIGTLTVWISSVIAMLAVLLAVFVSGTVTRPLLQLKKMIVEWSKGSSSWQETFEADEVGAIGDTFKRMTTENKQLGERLVRSQLKKREAELQTLQAQIKPHFLYNTLDWIYWMAVIKDNQEIAQMAVSLSESFKLSLNKGKELISVFKELKHIEHYMTIQNIRYNNRFRYHIEVEPELMGIEILKLLLQPIVENAIYHGLERKVGEGNIQLTGRVESGFIIFVISDDGLGFENMEDKEQGYGLRNVRERLLLYYGSSSSLQISSKPNEGTVVEIRFPEIKEGETDIAEASRF